MVNVTEHDTKNVTFELISVLGSVTVFFTVMSIALTTYVVHNPYAATYYTIDSMFDAVGVDEAALFYTNVQQFSTPFYILMLVSLMDGLVKIIIVGFVVAALVNTMAIIGHKARLGGGLKKGIRGHYIVCGYSGLAEHVLLELQDMGLQLVVIEKDQARADLAEEAGLNTVRADFTSTQALRDAGVAGAKGIMFLTDNDYENLLGVVTARHLNPQIRIISKVEDANAITKVHRAGAELCVVPEVLAGLELGESIINRYGAGNG